jgi:competence protein ComGC
MKAFGLLALVLVLGIVGYLMVGNGSTGPNATSELGQAAAAKGEEDRARAAMSAAKIPELKSAVQQFMAAKGRLPASLDELKAAGFIQDVPAGISYDPATGAVNGSQP